MSGADVTPAAAIQQAAQASTPWGRLVAVLGVMGVAFSWYAQNIETAGPALSSPPALVVSYFAAVGIGMAVDHWFFARPRLSDMRAQLARMEAHIHSMDGLISELRKEERALREDKGHKTAEITELRTSLKYLREDLDALRAEAVPENPKPGRRRVRTPKGDPT
ncbi:MAG: hypothetical protein IPK75_01270 [Acidobacteria bacterium]|nr:hypothetical protein [Acidobacteriota bacterium]